MKINVLFKIGIILIISGIMTLSFNFVYAFINDYNSNIENGKEIEEKVNNLYDSFLTSISLYKENLNKTYDSFNLYITDIPSINNELLQNINEVKEIRDELDILSIKLDNKCSNKLSTSAFITKCSNYAKVEKDIDSAYNQMISDYNSIISKYNNYAKNKGEKLIKYIK